MATESVFYLMDKDYYSYWSGQMINLRLQSGGARLTLRTYSLSDVWMMNGSTQQGQPRPRGRTPVLIITL